LNQSVIRITSAQLNQLLAHDSRGQMPDRLCRPSIKPWFELLVSQVSVRQSPMSVTLLFQTFGQDAALTVLPLLDQQGQCRQALATLDLAGGQFCCETIQDTAPFSVLKPVHYARRPCPSPKENDALLLFMGGKKGAQNPARPYLKMVSWS
jgi:hypothetical protein